MTSKTIKGVVIFGALAIVSIIAIQSYLLINAWNLEEEKFDERVNIALLNVAKDLADFDNYPLPSKNIVKQVSPDYYIVNINNVINTNILEFYLEKELESFALKDDFEYWIYDCASEEMVFGNFISHSGHTHPDTTQRHDLPIYDEFEYYFGVRFPNRVSFLLGKMSLPAVFLVILFITVLFFLYAMFVILRQRQLAEMQKDFINNMTHEFKTPISTINISSDVLLENEDIKQNNRLLQYASIIKDQNQRLNHQVEKVLQIARIERESFKLNLEDIDLHELLNQILTSTEIKVKQIKGAVHKEFNASHPRVKADKLHLTNILHNLLDNAVKYCRKNPKISIVTKDLGDKIQLSIIDNGIGIPKEHQGKVFKKFYRVPTGNVHNVKGFGLGLFYIKNVCHTHGWKVFLNSEEGKGTEIGILMKKNGGA